MQGALKVPSLNGEGKLHALWIHGLVRAVDLRIASAYSLCPFRAFTEEVALPVNCPEHRDCPRVKVLSLMYVRSMRVAGLVLFRTQNAKSLP